MTPLSSQPERRRHGRDGRISWSNLFALFLLPALFLSALAQTDKKPDAEGALEDVLKSMAEKPGEMSSLVSDSLLKFINEDHVSASFKDQEGLKAAVKTRVSAEIAAAGDSRVRLGKLFLALEAKNDWPTILASNMKPWTAPPDPQKAPDASSKGRLQDGPNLADWTAAFLSDAEQFAGQAMSRRADDKGVADMAGKPENQVKFSDPGAWREGARKVGAIADKVGQQVGTGDIAGLYKERQQGQVDAGPGPDGRFQSHPAPPPLEIAKAAAKGFAMVAVPPLALIPPVPSDAYRQKQAGNAILGKIIDNGASRAAVQETKRVIGGMLANADPDVLERLVDRNVSIEIIPKDKKLTDVPSFTQLRGKKTFDGRPWEDVRGVGNVPVKSGGHACASPEEGVISTGDHGGYRRNFVLVHEYAHMIHLQGLAPKPPDPGLLDKVKALWAGKALPKPKGPTTGEVDAQYAESMKRANKTGLGDYADSNSAEMFAQATAAYFDVGYLGEDAAKLKTINLKLHDLMNKVYGAPRSLKG